MPPLPLTYERISEAMTKTDDTFSLRKSSPGIWNRFDKETEMTKKKKNGTALNLPTLAPAARYVPLYHCHW